MLKPLDNKQPKVAGCSSRAHRAVHFLITDTIVVVVVVIITCATGRLFLMSDLLQR